MSLSAAVAQRFPVRQETRMSAVAGTWDYLIVTASNDRQAAAYRQQIELRRRLGFLSQARDVLVVADPGGRRVGSGGSTVFCLLEVLRRCLAGRGDLGSPAAWRETLGGLRILIVHAGGDSRRLPAYGPCGKVFVPVPADSDSTLGATLFDRQMPTYLALPAMPEGRGQVVVTSGDVLLVFEPEHVRFESAGITGLGCRAAPQRAARHGVYCAADDGTVLRFLQKPAPAEQGAKGAIDRYGQTILDIGVMNLDGDTAVALLGAFGAAVASSGELAWSGEMGRAIDEHGLDFYCEIACAMGTDAGSTAHAAAARSAGSRWPDALLGRLFQALRAVPFRVRVLPHCGFLHFGTSRQIIDGGLELLRLDRGVSQLRTFLTMNSVVAGGAEVSGTDAWVEGCRIDADLHLGGDNVAVGLDVRETLTLPPHACLDVIAGRSRDGRQVAFVRCYATGDTFKDTVAAGATLCGRPVLDWLADVGLTPGDVWPAEAEVNGCTVWDARVFPAAADEAGYPQWLWLVDPQRATDRQRLALKRADRYSLAEIAALADQDAFHARRSAIRAAEVGALLRRLFRLDSGFSAADLAHAIASVPPRARAAWIAQLLAEAHWHHEAQISAAAPSFTYARIIHTLGTALALVADGENAPLDAAAPGLEAALPAARRQWLEGLELAPRDDTSVGQWAARAHKSAFAYVGQAIVTSGRRLPAPPRSALRADEIVWGRAPARLDLGGGWSDTPPYSLEHGGCVINAAVDLNGQPPIHCYARVIRQPVVRIGSIDVGTRVEVAELEELLDFRSATSEFALAKAALALSGFAPEAAEWGHARTLRDMLERFGGGIELTTLAAIPKGSGLGTSSIVGAVILAVVERMMGRQLTRQGLFHGVLRLEQALSTGGGWQDQVGGAVDGVKVVTTQPGLVPDMQVHYVPADLLDPAANGGQTLLYYTGITRLARNILQQVVGRYLDRDRAAMETLRRIHALPPHVADAMARKDMPAFGRAIDTAWRLNKQLDWNSSTPQIEAMLDRVRPHVHGAKLLGAGGGGFLLMVCKSPNDAGAVRRLLEAEPPNGRARFFDFAVSGEGLVVTVC